MHIACSCFDPCEDCICVDQFTCFKCMYIDLMLIACCLPKTPEHNMLLDAHEQRSKLRSFSRLDALHSINTINSELSDCKKPLEDLYTQRILQGSRHIQSFTATKININFVHLGIQPKVRIYEAFQQVVSTQIATHLPALYVAHRASQIDTVVEYCNNICSAGQDSCGLRRPRTPSISRGMRAAKL